MFIFVEIGSFTLRVPLFFPESSKRTAIQTSVRGAYSQLWGCSHLIQRKTTKRETQSESTRQALVPLCELREPEAPAATHSPSQVTRQRRKEDSLPNGRDLKSG